MAEPTYNAVVTLRNLVSPWLMILQVVPDGWDVPEYIPGQFTSLGLLGSSPRCDLAQPEISAAAPDKLIKRAYCIASSPGNRDFLEFYVALVPGGALTPRLFNLNIGDRLWLSPKVAGRFTFDNSQLNRGDNVVLIATGSGLAPFMSMLSTYVKFPPEYRVALDSRVRHSWDLGYRSILMTMERLRTNFTYLPVVSRLMRSLFPGKA